jgi:hypothetical protein
MLGSMRSNAPKFRRLSKNAVAMTLYSASGCAQVGLVVVPAATAALVESTTRGSSLYAAPSMMLVIRSGRRCLRAISFASAGRKCEVGLSDR